MFSAYHIFAHCTALKFLWEALDCALLLMGFQFRFVKAKHYGILDLRQSKISKRELNIVLYLNTLSNFKIWDLRKKIQYDGVVFEKKTILTSIYRAIS